MKGIDNKPFINCHPFVDISYLENNYKEICLQIAKSHIQQGVYGPGILKEDEYGSYIKFMRKYLKEDPELVSGLGRDQQNIFFKLYEGMFSASTVSYIRNFKDPASLKSYLRKSTADGTVWTANKEFFPDLINWIYSELPFNEIGRILFFIHEHHCEIPIHRDGTEYHTHNNEFLWINPRSTKKFFIYNEETSEKNYVTTPVAFFNDLDLHGGDPINSMSWSLRVDGKFTDEFRKQLKIDHLTTY
jgi:hypothetical protein